MKSFICWIILFILGINNVDAQDFQGTWKAEKMLNKGLITIELRIGKPQNEILYPAHIDIEYQKFKGTYEVLLAQKDAHTLAIGRDKVKLKESHLNLGALLVGLNGYLHLENQELMLQPMDFAPQNYNLGEMYANHPLKEDLKAALFQQKLIFKYIGKEIPDEIATQKITNPSSTDIYFGVYRPIIVQNGMVSARIFTEKQTDADSATLVVNGKTILEHVAVKNAPLSGQINLKKGLNTFVLFADNFGKIPSNSGILKIYTAHKSYQYSLANKANQYGTFLVALVELKSQNEPVPFENQTDALSKSAAARVQKNLGKIYIQNPKVKLELWDAQEEDADSVSIGLNNEWIAKNVAVKNKAKVISLPLKKGKNTLLFMAQNLGLIPPNTSFVKLKFDNQERIIEINTDLQKNNILELYLE